MLWHIFESFTDMFSPSLATQLCAQYRQRQCIYDATTKSWSIQATYPSKFDYSNSVAILDHDANLFRAFTSSPCQSSLMLTDLY